jgi:IS5 family transposase
VSHLERALDAAHITPTRLYADKGYASTANRKKLRQRHIKSIIMYKAQRNTPLSPEQRQANKRISHRRYVFWAMLPYGQTAIWHGACQLLRHLQSQHTSYPQSLCMNLLKTANKILLKRH